MGLEAPLALLGLAGALLPLLAHRIRRRDLVPIPLPTMALLLRAEASKRRSRGLTDILLLAVRIAVIAIACLAVSAPYVTARLSFGDGTLASAAIVIDDSLSMMRRDDGSSLLSVALERAAQAIDSLPAGSEVALIAAGAPARLIAKRTDDLVAARLALSHVSPESVRGNALPAGVALAAQQLSGARHENRRMLVLSDFAAHTELDSDELTLDGIGVTLERLGSVPPAPNLSFAAVSALADPTTKGQTSLSIEVVSTDESKRAVPVSVHNGSREVARSELTMSQGRARGVIHIPTPKEQGDPTALLRIEVDDSLVEDNETGVLLRRTDALHVMLVNGDPHPASTDDELYYAHSALRLSPLPLSVRSVDANSLVQHDLTRIDVLVLANVEAPPPEVVSRLTEFVEGGGGLIVSAGDNVAPRRYNAVLGTILPTRIRARTGGKPLGLRLEDSQTNALLPEGPTGLSNMRASKRLVLEGGASAPLRFADGTPALAIADIGRGRSALLATSLDDDWSDLPFRPGYLPLLSRLLQDVARAHDLISGPIAAGQSVEIGIPPAARRLEVVGPDGAHHRYDNVHGLAKVAFKETQRPGPYRVMAAGGGGASLGDLPRRAFVVATPAAESDLTPAPALDAGPLRVTGKSPTSTIRRSIAPLLFLLCALLVLGEGALRLRVR